MNSQQLRQLIRRGAIREIGCAAWSVYLVIVDRIWRAEGGDRRLAQAIQAGKIGTVIGQAEIETKTGLTPPSIRKALRSLQEAGWIVVVSGTGHDKTVYIVGDQVGGQETLLSISTYKESFTPGETNLHPGGKDLSPRGKDLLPPYKGSKEGSTQDPISNAHTRGKRSRSWGEFLGKVEDRSAPAPTDQIDRGVTLPSGSTITAEDLLRRGFGSEDRLLLTSLIAKRQRGSTNLTSAEIVVGWRFNFFERFGYADTELKTTTAQRRAMRLVERRALNWFGNNTHELYDYLRSLLAWWSERKAKGERWPGPAVPHLESDALAEKLGVNRYLDEMRARASK